MKKPFKKKAARKKPVDSGPRMAMPGWRDVSDVFDNGAIVQVKRTGPGAHVDIRLPASSPKGSITYYVQGSVEDAAKWLLANQKKLRYAVNLGTEK